MILELPTLRGTSRTDRRTLVNLTNSLGLRDFESTVGSEHNRYTIHGSVTDDSTITVEVRQPNSTTSAHIPLTESTVLSEYIPLRLAFRNDLSVGDTVPLAELDPAVLTKTNTRFVVAAESTIVFPDSAAWDSVAGSWKAARWDTLMAWYVEPVDGTGSVSMWVGSLGQIISATYQSGVTWQRTAFEVAFHNFRARADSGAALIREGGIFGTAIAAGITELDESRPEIRLIIGAGWPNRDGLVDGRQTFVGDALLVQAVPRDVVDPTLRIPIAGNASLVEYMRPDAVLNSRDPRIQAQARLATAGTTRANRAAQRIVRWVYENIEKRADIGVPSAVHVLERRAGDSYEHAILFVALARAIGLPARTVGGLLYVSGRFYYHNWAEVHLGQGWLAVDPTFGQQPADASHLRLVYGGRPSDLEMVRLIGNLRVDIVGDGE
jgi:hypothetical protein